MNYTLSGTATSGDDYTALSGTLTFAAGEERKTVWVSVTDDNLSEASETVFLGISKRTLENWEQERATPRGYAVVALMKLIAAPAKR